MIRIIFFLLYCRVSGLNNIYDLAAQCANDMLEKNPSLPNQWIYANGTFGGRESPYYVGWVNHAHSNIPDVNMMDGPQGVRDILNGKWLQKRISWPAASVYGLAWSPVLAFYGGKFGAADWHSVNSNCALTPGVNVHRVPINGRNWEYISGEDPHLGKLGADLIYGLQSTGLMGTLKHFILNNQELNREHVISSIDEETLMETYARAFQPSIDAGVGSVMSSYNQIQFDRDNRAHVGGSYAYTGGSGVLSNILRNTMGFKGAWMTDWGAKVTNTTSNKTTVQRQFVEWEMVWGSNIRTIVPQQSYKNITRNSLIGMLASGILSDKTVPSCNKTGVKVPTKQPEIDHLPTQYQNVITDGDIGEFSAILVAEGMVLLKNTPGFLPLQPSDNRLILLIGTALLNGGGSGDSSAFGYDAPNHNGEGLHNGGRIAQNLMVSNLQKYTGATVEWDFEVKKYNPSNYDIIISFGGQFRSEEYLVHADGYYNIDQCNSSRNFTTYGDCHYRSTLQGFQQARSQGTKVIAITTTGGVHYPDYLDLVDAAITIMYPGQYFARGLSKVLSGAISPGGKLTYTLPDLEDDKLHIQSPIGRFNPGLRYDKMSKKKYTIQYPAYMWDNRKNTTAKTVQYDFAKSTYGEKNLVGYKYFEKFEMIPLFPFGYGLSYANYEVIPNFSNCQSHASCKVDFLVRDSSSKFTGIASEVLQVYIGYQTTFPNDFLPVKELRGFRKIWSAGTYQIELGEDAFMSRWDVALQSWTYPCSVYPGWFVAYAGTSSKNILATVQLSC